MVGTGSAAAERSGKVSGLVHGRWNKLSGFIDIVTAKACWNDLQLPACLVVFLTVLSDFKYVH